MHHANICDVHSEQRQSNDPDGDSPNPPLRRGRRGARLGTGSVGEGVRRHVVAHHDLPRQERVG